MHMLVIDMIMLLLGILMVTIMDQVPMHTVQAQDLMVILEVVVVTALQHNNSRLACQVAIVILLLVMDIVLAVMATVPAAMDIALVDMVIAQVVILGMVIVLMAMVIVLVDTVKAPSDIVIVLQV